MGLRLFAATPEEAQRLWDALAKQGKRWNPETMAGWRLKRTGGGLKGGENYLLDSYILQLQNSHYRQYPLQFRQLLPHKRTG